jgi:hypothetical protein
MTHWHIVVLNEAPVTLLIYCFNLCFYFHEGVLLFENNRFRLDYLEQDKNRIFSGNNNSSRMVFTLNNKVIYQLLINRSEIERYRNYICFERIILEQKISKLNKRKRTSETKKKFGSVQLF